MATKRKRKNTGGKPLIITFVCLVAVTLAVFGVFFGADKYERSTHPMLYSDLVDRYSSQYKLDKYAVYSFICVEVHAVKNVTTKAASIIIFFFMIILLL